MNKRLLSTTIILVFIMIIITGCAPTAPKFPTGEYIAHTDTVLNFMPDGKCILSYPPQNAIILTEENCEYTIDGDTFFISTGETNKCEPADGVYKWTLDGEQLIFELIEDNCEGRIDSMSEPLTLYKPDE